MTDESYLPYDAWIEDALRSVIRQAIAQAAETGLPGEHHFYVTFRTDHPLTEVPDRLHEQYPEEMTVVLQHQFDGLEVDDVAFGVTLYFGGVPTRLYVPFEAVTSFADPSVNFGLQLKAADELTEEEAAELEVPETLDLPIDTDAADDAGARTSAEDDGNGDDGDDDDDGGKSGEVIALDKFRKKQKS